MLTSTTKFLKLIFWCIHTIPYMKNNSLIKLSSILLWLLSVYIYWWIGAVHVLYVSCVHCKLQHEAISGICNSANYSANDIDSGVSAAV